MKRTKLSFYLIFISVFTFLTLLVSIVQKSYSNLTKPLNKTVDSSLLKSIDPKLDMDTIKAIEDRESVSIDTVFKVINLEEVPVASASITTVEASSEGQLAPTPTL